MRSALAAACLLSAAALMPSGAFAQTAPAIPDAQGSPQAQQGGKPANLCQELVAYLDKPVQKPGSDPNLTTAVQAPKTGEAHKANGEGAPTQSGLSAPTGQQVGQGAPGPQGDAQNQAAPKSALAPTTPSAPQQPGEAQVTLADAQGLAAANDLPGCRDATQRLRRAGAPLPPELIALGALDLKFFTN